MSFSLGILIILATSLVVILVIAILNLFSRDD